MVDSLWTREFNHKIMENETSSGVQEAQTADMKAVLSFGSRTGAGETKIPGNTEQQHKKRSKTKKVIVVKIPQACNEDAVEKGCRRENTRNSITQNASGGKQTDLDFQPKITVKIRNYEKFCMSKGQKKNTDIIRGWPYDRGLFLLLMKPFGLQIPRLQSPQTPARNVSVRYLRRAKKKEEEATKLEVETKGRCGRSPPRKAATICHLDASQNDRLKDWMHGKDHLERKQRQAKRKERRAERRERRRKEKQKEERARACEEAVKEWMERKQRAAGKTGEEKQKKAGNIECAEPKCRSVSRTEEIKDPYGAGKYRAIKPWLKSKGSSGRSAISPETDGEMMCQAESEGIYLSKKAVCPFVIDPLLLKNKNKQRAAGPVQSGTCTVTNQRDVPMKGRDLSDLVNKHMLSVNDKRVDQKEINQKGPRNNVMEYQANKSPKKAAGSSIKAGSSARKVTCHVSKPTKEKSIKSRQNGKSNNTNFQPTKEVSFQGRSSKGGSGSDRAQAKLNSDDRESPEGADGKVASDRMTHSQWLQKKTEEEKERKLREENMRLSNDPQLNPQLKYNFPKASRGRLWVTEHGRKMTDMCCNPDEESAAVQCKVKPYWLEEARLTPAMQERFLKVLDQITLRSSDSVEVLRQNETFKASKSPQGRLNRPPGWCPVNCAPQVCGGAHTGGKTPKDMSVHDRPDPQGSEEDISLLDPSEQLIY